jgi:hypothetical protein
MSAQTASTQNLRRDTRIILEFSAFMADMARVKLECIAESTDAPERADILAADALDAAIQAIDSAKRQLAE